ncbi:TlpA family protein disulfide reductase [Aureitalea marina]|uniref:Thioredoxin-like fold domain-containing protein n=1 Tax=Aureitalea marina TaxID=930804 RepID=A0A2S7KN50_9FLAO|nr:thioredoxin-like domain-containing protein [Aureitalea marina]PQB04057.1 hypothetical protein BST85_03430 [Aureitalea marina]
MIRTLLGLFYIAILFSCASERCDERSSWIGGEIVNPKLDHVLLFHNDIVVDTIPLQSNNFFLYESNDLKEGLYSFQHYEYQVFYVEPGDSLMLRVNTVDFDESLTFSGRGAPKNNLMIEMFLINEKEDQLLSSQYALPPEEFQAELDSLQDIRWELLTEFKEKHQPGPRFAKLMEANVDYDFFARKELYLTANASNYQRNEQLPVPASFTAHRMVDDYDDCDVHAHYSYYRYINRLFDNLAYEQYQDQGRFNRNSFRHNFLRMQLVDSLIDHEHLKNMMLRSNIGRYLINANNEEEERNMLDLFMNSSTNEDHKLEIQRLAENAMKLTPDHIIPNVALISYDQTSVDLHEVIRRPTVFYFWNTESSNHYKSIHERVASLKSDYPKFDFVGINTGADYRKWRKIIDKMGYFPSREYLFDNVEVGQEKLMVGSINKAIIIDGSGNILEGNSNLFYRDIEAILAGISQ